ncbi:uncharacterized protein LOC130092383 [Rhinichthys klamathensis goyatoka]|uniref:uncharacterized protein LOC130092383 n=1 Tax=Rhinichthys klamathensis goyatoka TaxID=3034132 RepID=UPI0024B60E9F|nr:uncharacterized protein LOC130092383 [Rhinichthys klamathensis goyatoka]
MYSYTLLLLLFCFINYSESPPEGNNLKHVTEKKGENVTLSCESDDREITVVKLSRLSKNILVCENEECKSENGRVCKEGSCDVIINDLIYSDAGKYILLVYYYNNDQREVKRQIREYHLHIHDEISVKKGEDLKLDVLLINADKVERNSRSGWTEVWRRGHGVRGHGVSSDRLTVSDQTLIIHDFTVTDTGTYRALDSNNEALITVTVTESRTESKGKLDNTDDDTEQISVWYWISSGGMIVYAVLLVLTLITLVVMYDESS